MNEEHDVLPGTLEFLILKALSWGPRHGYAIARWFRETTSEGLQVEEGALYPALHRLEKRKLVKGAWVRSPTNRRIRQYTITEAGLHELQRQTEGWSRYVGLVGRLLRSSN